MSPALLAAERSISADSVLRQLEKILASASFRGSPPLRRFLRYSVEHSLRGQGNQLKEYRLGVEVFGRPATYDPRKEPLVRLEARRLRAKLREYYEDEGRNDPIRIGIPKGAYAATFVVNNRADQPVNAAARHAGNGEAFQPYLLGRYNWCKRTEEGFRKAIEYFERAIDRDPECALAYSGRADSYVLLAEYTLMPSPDAMERARAMAMTALQLDETLAEVHTSLGAVKVDYEWDWQGAEQEFHRAIELNPGYATAHQWYAELLSQQEKHQEAVAEIQRALQLDPLSLIVNAMAGRILLYAGLVDAAIEQLHKTLDIEPNFSIANYDLGKAYLQKGMLARAIAEFQKSVNLFGVSERGAALGYAYARAGKESEANNLLETYLRESKQTYVFWYGIAFLYAGLGMNNQALTSLEKACDQHEVGLRNLKVEPLFENLRLDPRFTLLVRRIGLPS
jgi:tetratricopeptide (TPR) repeat protein